MWVSIRRGDCVAFFGKPWNLLTPRALSVSRSELLADCDLSWTTKKFNDPTRLSMGVILSYFVFHIFPTVALELNEVLFKEIAQAPRKCVPALST